MKYVAPRPFADPAVAARKLLEIANAVEAVQDGRIHIEKINAPFLFKEGGTPAEYGAALDYAIAKGTSPSSSNLTRFGGRVSGGTGTACCLRFGKKKTGAMERAGLRRFLFEWR